MAQDFGDDMGNALLNFVTRQTENYLRFGRGRERAFDWWQRHYKKEGNTPEQAKAMAEKQSSREQVVVPFGTSEEAAYYAQVCRENGTYAAAYTDKQGNGFLAFAKEDVKTVAGYVGFRQAKDATASRNGLSRNQMGIEEKAAECKEAATVLANGNAL